MSAVAMHGAKGSQTVVRKNSTGHMELSASPCSLGGEAVGAAWAAVRWLAQEGVGRSQARYTKMVQGTKPQWLQVQEPSVVLSYSVNTINNQTNSRTMDTI